MSALLALASAPPISLRGAAVIDADHPGGWWRSGLVGTNPAQHGLAAARQPLPRELAGARRPTQHQAGVALGLARPGGGVCIRAGHRRHALGEGLPTTGGGIAKKAPHLEREADRERRPGQIGQRPAVTAMNAGGRLRTGGTGGGRCGDLHVQGQAMVLEGESLHLERRWKEASIEVVQQQRGPSCMSDRCQLRLGETLASAIIPDRLGFTNSGQEPPSWQSTIKTDRAVSSAAPATRH